MKIRRKSFASIKEVIRMPDLLSLQVDSYKEFLQEDETSMHRKLEGLEDVFQKIFPIESNDKRIILYYDGYEITKPQYSVEECIDRDLTYAVAIKVNIRLITFDENGEIEKMPKNSVYFGELPYITERGTFIFNGAERVIVSQFHRSPGIFFESDEKKDLIIGKIIPYFGSWLQFEIDSKGIVSVRPDKRKKMPVTTFLRALGLSSNSEILSQFYESLEVNVSDKLAKDDDEQYLFEDIVYEETGEYIGQAGEIITLKIIDQLKKNKISKIKILDKTTENFSDNVLNTMLEDSTSTDEEALKKLIQLYRGNAKMPYDKAKEYISGMFFNPKRYNLSEVGRYKINLKFNENNPITDNALKLSDIITLLKYMINLKNGVEGYEFDDIDHLANRRIRCVGELLKNEYRKGLLRLEKTVLDKLSSGQVDLEDITPRTLVNIKPITAIIREFFGTSPLSQFMDQTNPVSELTHKRRLTALGPGGLTRERAGFEVRDVHHTHYGRVCPIETPEGPNIGLIVSLSTYAKINSMGFIETPYRKVENGIVTEKIEYLNAMAEDKYYIAQANAPIDSKNRLMNEEVNVRYKDDFLLIPPEQVDYMDVSPKQLISTTTALIPFLEHDDANRALMGSNMQRQAVPLMYPKTPIVGTGMEEIIAKDSRVTVSAKNGGVVKYIASNIIRIETNKTHKEDVVDEDTGEIIANKGDKIIDEYNLLKFRRSNQGTTINQKPIVEIGDKIKEGEVIADGLATEKGHLALGSNALVAFMSWEGYNFEDAVLISERLVKEDVYTSLHIEKFEVYARDTKLGKEQITRDIPNLSEDALKYLDEDGIIKVGSKVKAGDILVGKVTPKSQVESTPEQKLLQSIFGEKARDVRDTSLKLKHGNEGTVIDIKIYSRKQKDELPAGVERLVKVYVATKRKIKEGDKVAGRHGNKGVISRVLPEEDMPFLEDGTPVDIVLNPLGVPSRMNIGQILETHLGWVGEKLGEYYATDVFDGASEKQVIELMEKVGIPSTGKVSLFDGLTGEKFEQDVTVGQIYMMKLNHLVDEKIHARSIGPYSLVTQQPLGGKAQFGGQRLGEMEVWALEAYGAAYTLREMLTVKSDDIFERSKIYESIVKGIETVPSGIPESFNVLIHELEGLCLRIHVTDHDGNEVDLKQIGKERLDMYNQTIPGRLKLEDIKELSEPKIEEEVEEKDKDKIGSVE